MREWVFKGRPSLPALFLLIPSLGSAIPMAGPPLPNFLLIVADDMGAHTGRYGTPGVRTPTLDSLAVAGVRFKHAQAPSATCSVSRASLLTGTHPHTHNTRINVHEHFGPDPAFTASEQALNDACAIADSLSTLVETLSKAGYRTGITHKFHMSPHRKFPFTSWMRGLDQVPAFLQAAGGKPWFVMVNIGATHRPFGRNRKAGPLPDTALIRPPGHLPPTALVKQDWSDYLNGVQVIDADVKATLQILRQSGQAENTVVVFTGDHGPAYHRGKYSPYGLGVNVPLIFAGPRHLVTTRPEGSELPASLVDVLPTFLDYAGLALTRGIQGVSLLPTLQGRTGAKTSAYLFAEVHHGHSAPGTTLQERSIFDGRFRLVFRDLLDRRYTVPEDDRDITPWGNRVYGEIIARKAEFPREYAWLAQRDSDLDGAAPACELFDTSTDPWELKDLGSDPNYASDRSRLATALRAWGLGTGDAYLDYRKLSAVVSLGNPGISRVGSRARNPVFSDRAGFLRFESGQGIGGPMYRDARGRKLSSPVGP